MKEVAPYSKLAHIYDQLMDHVDYPGWATYIQDIFHQMNLEIGSIIDLSCGTGSLALNIQNSAIKFLGCDHSWAMIDKARQKSQNLPLIVSDVRKLAILENIADCVLFLYDSLNYIISDNDLKQTLSEIYRITKTGGLFTSIRTILASTASERAPSVAVIVSG